MPRMGYQKRHERRMERRENRQERRDQRVDKKEARQDRKREKYTGRKEYVFDKRIDKAEARAVRRANRSQRPDFRKLKRREADETAPLTEEEYARDQLLESGARVYLEREDLRDQVEALRRQVNTADNQIDKDLIRQELKAVEKQLKQVDQEFQGLEVEFNLERKEWKRTRNWKGKYRHADFEELVRQEYVDEVYNADTDLHAYDDFGVRHDRNGIDRSAPYQRALRVNLKDPSAIALALKESGRSPEALASGDEMAIYALGLVPGELEPKELQALANSSTDAYENVRDMVRAKKELLAAGTVPSKLGNIAERVGEFVKKPEGIAAVGGLLFLGYMAWKNKDSLPKPIRDVFSFLGWGAVVGGGLYAADKVVQNVNPRYKGISEMFFGAAGNPDTYFNSENMSRVRDQFPENVRDDFDSALLTGNMKVRDMIVLSRKALRTDDPKYIEKDFTWDMMNMSPHINNQEYKKLHGPRSWDYFQELSKTVALRSGLKREDYPSDDAYVEAGLQQLESWDGNMSLFALWAHLQAGNSPARAQEHMQYSSEQYRSASELQALVIDAGMDNIDLWPNGEGRVSIEGWSYEVQETNSGYLLRSTMDGPRGEYKGQLLLPAYEGDQLRNPEETLTVARQLKARSIEFMRQEVKREFGSEMQNRSIDFNRHSHAWEVSPALQVKARTFRVEIHNPTGEKLKLRARAQNGELVNGSFDSFGPLVTACGRHADKQGAEERRTQQEKEDEENAPGLIDQAGEKLNKWKEGFIEWMDDWPIKEGMGRKTSELTADEHEEVMDFARESLDDIYSDAKRLQVSLGPVAASYGDFGAFLSLVVQSHLDEVKGIMGEAISVREAQVKIDTMLKKAVDENNTVSRYAGPYRLSKAMETLMPSVTSNKPEAERLHREQVQKEAEKVRGDMLEKIDTYSEANDLAYADLDRIYKESAKRRLDKIIAAGQIQKLDVFDEFIRREASDAFGLIVQVKKHEEDLSSNSPYFSQLVVWLGLLVPRGIVKQGKGVWKQIMNYFTGNELESALQTIDSTFDTHWKNGSATSGDATAYVKALGPAVKNSLDLMREW